MMAWIGVFLLFLLCGGCKVDALRVEGAEDSSSDAIQKNRKSLSIDEVTSLLVTEAHTQYSNDRRLKEDTTELWSNAIDFEWSRARDLENSAQQNSRTLRRTASTGMFPFVVCDVEPGKVGEKCRATVEESFGTGLLPISNHIDQTCYIVSALASVAQSASEGLLVSPMLPEMKLERGFIDSIVFADPMPRKFEATLCPGEVSSKEKSKILIEAILTRTEDQEYSNGRHLAANFFTEDESRETTEYDRSFQNRTLKEEMNSDVCQDVFESLRMDVNEKGEMFFFETPVEATDEDVRRCLLLLTTGLAAQPEVCSIGIVPGMVPLDIEAQWVTQSRLKDYRPFFEMGLDGRGEVLGISDTGLDIDNCYFWDDSGSVAKDGTVDLSRRKVVQYVALGDDSDETKGHGTHVCGTAVGKRAVDGLTESIGKADGIAPGAKLAFVDLGVAGKETLDIPFPPSSVYQHGVSAGSNIHSSSWGFGYNHYSHGERDIDSFMFRNPDYLVVLACGNSGDQLHSVGSPATCKNAIAVGASQNGVDHTGLGMLGEDFLAWFSSAGPTHDGRMKPDVIAPGYYIRSAEARPEREGECDEEKNNVDGLMYSAGTSMAAPVVAGTAAIIRQYFEEGWSPSGAINAANAFSPSSSLIKAVLINGARPLEGRQQQNYRVTQSSEYDEHQGFGAIVLINSLPLAGKNQLQAIVVDKKSISNNEEDLYPVTIDTSNGCDEPLSATLAWTDPPGAANCQQCLLNNLDLEISLVSPSTTTFYPNGLSRADNVNNVERIRIVEDIPDGSIFNVRVKGTNLDSSSQNYSLVITGCLGQTASTRKEDRSRSQDTSCMNHDGTILIDDEIGMKSCSWLEENKGDYSFLCMFTDVATTCPDTCGVCPIENSPFNYSETRALKTGLNGTVDWYGSMFDVVAKANMTIKSLSFHTASTDQVQVSVYTKRGSYDGSEQQADAWTLIAKEVIVDGQGKGYPTVIPDDALEDVMIAKGNVQSFYITTGDSKNIVVSGANESTLQLNDEWEGNDDLTLLAGKAVTGTFGGSYSPYAWNGHVHYAVELGCVDGSETIAVENVGDKSCEWLVKNKGRFGHLCDRISVATSCPVTCNFCESLGY